MTDAPRYRLVGYDIGTAPDENGGWVHWTDHEAIVARLTAERDRFEAALGRACLVGGTTYLVDRAEKAETERDAALVGAVKVKPLVWDECEGNFHGQNVWCFDALKWMWIIQNNGGQYIWCEDVTPTWAPASPVRGAFDTLDAAKAAAQADYEARILAAIQPDPAARQVALAKAWTLGRDAAANEADEIAMGLLDNEYDDCADGAEDAAAAIRALTPPADLAAKIGGE